MISALHCSLSTSKTQNVIKEPMCIFKEYDLMLTFKNGSPFAKITNKFRDFQTISQYLDNKHDVNILKYTYTYLTFMKSIKTYETGPDLIQKIITYIFSIMF